MLRGPGWRPVTGATVRMGIDGWFGRWQGRLRRGQHAAWLAAALLVSVAPAHAFEPAVPSAEDLFVPTHIAVVLGRFVVSKTDPAVFLVEESLRGQVPSGRYTVFETGRFGSRGEPAVYAMSRPARDFPPGRVVLPVMEVDGAESRLVIPMAAGWRFRVVDGRVDDLMGFSTPFEPLARALRNGGAMPAWVPVKR